MLHCIITTLCITGMDNRQPQSANPERNPEFKVRYCQPKPSDSVSLHGETFEVAFFSSARLQKGRREKESHNFMCVCVEGGDLFDHHHE